MEEIRAEKVIAAWPKVGQAAVQDALTFLPEKLKAKLLDPASCLKPVHEWPSEPRQSRVKASDEEWSKAVRAAYERGLMVAVEMDEVFKDQKGRPVLNGAGAAKKEKKVDGQVISAQRFISNLIPSNMFQDRLEGDDKLLPYLGQLTLLEQGEEEVWLVDSEDFTSCFNLCRLPSVWHKFMAFEKPVDASLLGGEQGKKVYPAMAVLPMGWVSSVAVLQSIVRTLVFKEADIPQESEVAKTQPVPADEDLTVIYLDSYDQLRKFRKGCEEVMAAGMSERHERFLRVCEKLSLPLNEGKRLVASTLGALQGGELDGEDGRYGLSVQKMVKVITLGATMLAKDKWWEAELRHFIGKATFGCCFRRPLFAILENVFEEVAERASQNDREVPRQDAWDEVAVMVLLTPLMYTNLRAKVDPGVSVTDASPTGGGAATAVEFQPAPCTIERDPAVCAQCGKDIPGHDRYPGPAVCGATLCSLSCVLTHREGAEVCPRRTWRIPKFGERFAGPPPAVMDVGIPAGEGDGGVAGDEVFHCLALLLWRREGEVVRHPERSPFAPEAPVNGLPGPPCSSFL